MKGGGPLARQSENRLDRPWRCLIHQWDGHELSSVWPQCFTPSYCAPPAPASTPQPSRTILG